MMELRCAYILVLFSLVSATPHGYGTKGGASARAEASATSGAFEGIRGLPLSIPSGPGFSGSYSKSSSSSSSSASSSASSSSSSFSYGGASSNGLHGSGANSLAGSANSFAGVNNLAGSNAGCGSGACSNNKVDGISIPHGSDAIGTVQGYSGANAAADAKAVAGTYGFTSTGGIACAGSDCSNPSIACEGPDCLNKCKSGQCGVESSKNDKECSSGKCGEALQSQSGSASTQCSSGKCGPNTQDSLSYVPTTATFGSYDIPAKTYETKVTSDSKNQYTDKTSTGYYGAASNSKCVHGNCGFPDSKPSKGHDSHSNSEHLNSDSQVHGVPKCDTSNNCNAYDSSAGIASPGSGLTIGPTKPSTYLTTPKEGASCNSPACQSHFTSNTGKPSSYNVPLQTNVVGLKEILPCNEGSCGNHQLKNPYATQSIGSLPTGNVGSIGCTSPNCAKQPSSGFAPDCKSPGCAPNYASAPTNSGNGFFYQPGSTSSISVPQNPSYASPVLPTYKPENGLNNHGCKTPDCIGYAPGQNAGSGSGAHTQSGYLSGGSSPVAPSYSTPVFIPSTPTTGYVSSNCKTQNCVPHAPSNTGNYGVFGGTTVISSEHKQPATGYSEGFGGPSGILKPNEFSGPTHTHVVSPTQPGPSYTIKPSIEVSPSAEELPPYTGGFGGPHGILKPNEFNIHRPSTTVNTPALSISAPGQKLPSYTGGFGASSGLLKPNEIGSPNTGANSNAGSVGTHTPTSSISPSGPELPSYTGGFGAPSGLLKPNEVGSFPNAGTNSNAGSVGTHTSPSSISPSGPELPSYTGGFGASSGLLKPNEIGSPNTGANSNAGSVGTYTPTSSISPSGPELPSYTGGFGAPSGFLKPNEVGSFANAGANSNVGSVGNITPGYGITTPVQKVTVPTGGLAASSGILRPGIDAGITPVVHLGTPVVLQPITASYPTHQALPVPTSGSFAPVGSLQPNTYFSSNPAIHSNVGSGHVDSHGHHGHATLSSGVSSVDKDLPKHTGDFGSAAGTLKPNDFEYLSSNDYNKPHTTSTIKSESCSSGTCGIESSNAAAVAKAEAVAYSGGFGGPPGLLKPHDSGKLSGTHFGLVHGSTGSINSGVAPSSQGNGDAGKGQSFGAHLHSGAAAQSTAQASATAGATSGTFSSNGAYSGSQVGAHGDEHKSGSGCGGGCGGGSYHGSGPNFGSNSALSIAQAGSLDGPDTGLHGSGASAKSIASAGGRAFGGAGSYASSSASAHASAGYATKGGYGK